MNFENVVLIIATALGTSGVTGWLSIRIRKSKLRAEKERIEAEKLEIESNIYERLLSAKRVESDAHITEIKRLRERDRLREIQHNECEQRGASLQIRLELWEKKMKTLNITLEDVRKFNVFVLDDDEFVRDALTKKLGMLPNVVVSVFDDFTGINERINEQPEILVLDYRIHGQTIDQFVNEIIKMTKYDPKIILITGMPMAYFLNLPYKGFIWKHYNKEDDYINKTVLDIMQHISELIK
jgi:CheY-like chemotaxis protein